MPSAWSLCTNAAFLLQSWLRRVAAPVLRNARRVVGTPNITKINARPLHHLSILHCTDDELEARFIEYFNRCDIDGWDLRQGMNDICGLDMVPSPEICIAVMYACRRVNDYAIAVRFLEAVKDKCGSHEKEIYPWVIQEVMPVLVELGIETPEELCYDTPELCLENVYEIH